MGATNQAHDQAHAWTARAPDVRRGKPEGHPNGVLVHERQLPGLVGSGRITIRVIDAQVLCNRNVSPGLAVSCEASIPLNGFASVPSPPPLPGTTYQRWQAQHRRRGGVGFKSRISNRSASTVALFRFRRF